MLAWDFFWRGIVIGLAVAAPVGPVNILCMHRTLTHGRLNGFMAGLGAAVADAVFGFIAAFGLTAVADFLMSHQVYTRGIGGAFLIALGIRIFLSEPRQSEREVPNAALGRAIATTFVLTITNPMTIIGFVGIFAGLGLVRTGGAYAAASAVVAGVFLGSALWWLGISTVVDRIRHVLDDQVLVWTNRAAGVLIVIFALIAWASLL